MSDFLSLASLPEPNWQLTLVLGGMAGAIIGWLFNYFVTISGFALRSLMRKDPIEGEWTSYAPNYPGRGPKYRRYGWIIKKGMKDRLVVKAVSQRNSEMLYKGRVFYERQYVIMELYATHDDEAVYIRLQRSAPTLDSTMVGISLKHDYRGIASSGPIVFSREERDDEEIEKLIKERIKIDRSLRVLQMTQP